MNRSFIALGTNIEPRKKYIDEALFLLRSHEQIILKRKSTIYETAPVGFLEQADFLNVVIEIHTSLSAMALLEVCQSIEKKLGRIRTIKDGPRTIDLDILVYGNEIHQTKRLTLPHPRMKERAFVLVPFHEIASHFVLEPYGKTIEQLLKELPEESIQEVRKWKQK